MLHEGAGPRALGLFRVVVFGIWILQLLWTPVTRGGRLPPELFDAPGLLGLLPGEAWTLLLHPVALGVTQGVLLVLFAAAALGVRPFWVIGPLAALGLLYFDGFAKGWGSYVNHAQFASLYAGILLAVAPAADGFVPWRRGEARREQGPARRLPDGAPGTGAYRFPLVGTALLVAVTYALIGLHRLRMGGWEIFTGDALPTYMVLRTLEYSGYPFSLSLTLLDQPSALALLKAGFVAITLLEVLSPAALLSRRFRLLWLPAMVGFHLVTLVTMNIFFWENLILLAVVFTDLPSRLEAAGALTPPAPRSP